MDERRFVAAYDGPVRVKDADDAADAAGVVADLGALADDVMRRGEANRGRPDPVTDPLVVSDIGALWKRVAALEQQLAEVKATTDMLNAVVGRLLPA